MYHSAQSPLKHGQQCCAGCQTLHGEATGQPTSRLENARSAAADRPYHILEYKCVELGGICGGHRKLIGANKGISNAVTAVIQFVSIGKGPSKEIVPATAITECQGQYCRLSLGTMWMSYTCECHTHQIKCHGCLLMIDSESSSRRAHPTPPKAASMMFFSATDLALFALTEPTVSCRAQNVSVCCTHQ